MMPGATTSREAATEIGTPDIIQFTAEEFLKKDRFNNIPPAMKLIMAERIQSLYNDKLREPEFNQKKEEMLTFWGASSKESITTEVQNFINTSSENGVAMKDIITKANELAEKIISKGKKAITSALKSINAIDSFTLEKGLILEADEFGNCCTTDEFKEGTSAFLEKRKPLFER